MQDSSLQRLLSTAAFIIPQVSIDVFHRKVERCVELYMGDATVGSGSCLYVFVSLWDVWL